jgi:Two component regulator propeller
MHNAFLALSKSSGWYGSRWKLPMEMCGSLKRAPKPLGGSPGASPLPRRPFYGGQRSRREILLRERYRNRRWRNGRGHPKKLPMKFCRLIPLFFVIAAAFFTPLRRVDAQNRVDTWTTDNGLPQNSVTSLTRTPDGYIWFTTNDGLARFDGVHFKVFNKSNTPEITNNRMLGAFADKSGKLWVQTEDGGIFFYEKGIFKITKKPDEGPPIVRSSFFDDPSGGVIFYVTKKHSIS